MGSAYFDSLLREVSRDIKRLPLRALQIAAALVTAEPKLPGWLTEWVLAQMQSRADVDMNAPLAEAAMRLYIFSEDMAADYALQETHAQYALIKAMQGEHDLHIAVAFFQKIFLQFEEAALRAFQVNQDLRELLSKYQLKKQPALHGGDSGFAWLVPCPTVYPYTDIAPYFHPSMANNPEILLSHLSAIIAGSTDAIVTKSLDGIVTGWNRGAEKIFGYTAQEMLGKPMLYLFPQDRLQEETFILERLREGEEVNHFETVRKHKSGQHIHVSVTISPIRDASGVIVGASKIARDITERIKLESTTRQLEMIVQSSNDAILSKTLNGIVTSWNSGAERIFGFSADDMVGAHIDRLIPPDRLEEEALILERLARGLSVEHYETVRVRKDGKLVHVSVTISPIRDKAGQIIGASKIARDISSKKAAEKQLRLTSSVFTHTSEAIAITDAGGKILDVNDAFLRITGYSRNEVLGQMPSMFRSSRQGPEVQEALMNALKLKDHCQGEVWSRRKDGEAYAGLLTMSTVRDASGAVQNYVGIFADITALKLQQDRLEHVAHFDALTDLPNRILLADRMQQAIVMSRRHDRKMGVLYLDIDGFKAINDRYGHDVGDQTLIELANRMRCAVREADTVARMGGDEFVVVMEDVQSTQLCMDLAQRVLKACSDPVRVGDKVLQVSASIGVTVFPQDDADPEQLLRHADHAMYEAKQTGKNRCHLFDSVHHAEVRTRSEQIERISLALAHGEFVLNYQPKVNMRTGTVIGVEALIRWQHPTQGLLAPAAFLPWIEGHYLSDLVTEWVVREALRQMREWETQGLHIKVSVNVGAHQLQLKDFPEKLQHWLASCPEVNPANLELEILETTALQDIGAVSECMARCRRLGVRFAVDDFGTGYSSLTYLKKLPAGVLKIDQSFVRDMLDDHEDLAIVQGVIGLAKAFHREVLAEGCETVEQGLKLIELGCLCAQGFGISKAMPPELLQDWIEKWVPDPRWTSTHQPYMGL